MHPTNRELVAQAVAELAEAQFDAASAEANLGIAEAELAKAMSGHTGGDPEFSDSPSLESARLRCRRAWVVLRSARLRMDDSRARLADFGTPRLPNQAPDSIRGGVGETQEAALSEPADFPSHRAERAQADKVPVYAVPPSQRKALATSRFRIFTGLLSPAGRKYIFPDRGPARELLARQSAMLLALVLAYLQYYFLDVQLQVVVLRPSLVFGLLVG